MQPNKAIGGKTEKQRKERKIGKMDFLEESGFCPSSGIFYSKWDSPCLPYPTSLSLPSYLLSLTSHMLSKPAYVDARSGGRLTYGDLRTLTTSVASALHMLGIKKGDVVLLVSPNFLHFPLLVLGVMTVGAIFSTANPLNTRLELQTQVQDSNPVLILTTQELKPKLDGLIDGPTILLEELLAGLMRGPPSRTCKFPHVAIEQGDTAALMYSSGTTGKSKAVVCSHRSLIAMSCLLRHVWSAEGARAACDEVYMCVVPLFHMFGLSVFVCGVLAVGSTAVVLGKYAVEEMLVAVEEYGVTRLPAVPPMVVQLVRMADVAKAYDLGTLKEVICSGAPLGRDHMERFIQCFPQITLSQCYGLTETNGPITLCDGINGRFHVSIGRLIPSLEAKIVDVDTKEPLPPRKYGELYVRGAPVMQGYYKDEEATSLAIDKEGWLHTGDLCFIDTSGLVYVVDRIKELIKYKAYQVAPAELEEILVSHPEIADAAVIPYANVEAGEIPMACVVRVAESKLQEGDIISFMTDKVAPYKKVRKVVFVDSIPRSPSGKILRRLLRASTSRQRLEISPRL
ncbi:putative 4-coumarate--CoA ligase-like 8 [Magnolia sinica]|uniref:putative 4-coumarate--CoA ligase-like 8 n=1 Tax=Magnolia sinica TaxID=86752 RepID=UPI00265A0AB3|nr:putative 4-coumarate--CoA ligase-like 8 [Magnolia sinica]